MSGKLDVASLPPELRRKVEAGLAKLSPEMRRQWETQGSPMLDRLVARLAGSLATPPAPGSLAQRIKVAAQSAAEPRSGGGPALSAREAAGSAPTPVQRTPPRGHYNETIAPGDRPGGLQRVLLGLVLAGVVVWLLR